ncbi:MAG TPA: hypothetical protein VND96_05930 [Candidatus Micrarchaeaceae archaeon]|nr:hypothetical protein [Candidatus Micrarchaeaceae archaeon]
MRDRPVAEATAGFAAWKFEIGQMVGEALPAGVIANTTPDAKSHPVQERPKGVGCRRR